MSDILKQPTTAQALVAFATELAACKHVSQSALDDMVVIAARALIYGEGELAVKLDV